jgi:hypothetical protein
MGCKVTKQFIDLTAASELKHTFRGCSVAMEREKFIDNQEEGGLAAKSQYNSFTELQHTVGGCGVKERETERKVGLITS